MTSLNNMRNTSLTFISSFEGIVTGVYCLFCFAILIGVTFLLRCYIPNTWYLYTFPVSVLVLIVWYRWLQYSVKKQANVINDRQFLCCYIAIFLITLLVQGVVSFFYPFFYESDNLAVKEEAINLAQHGLLSDKYYTYFQAFPNNLNSTILFSIIYRMFGNWDCVTLVGAMLVNLSAVLTGLTVYNLIGSKMKSIVTLLVAEFILSFTFIAYLPYTHNYGILFPILTFYLYSSKISKYWKMLMIIVVTIIGLMIKVTTIIPFLAMVVIEFFKLLHNQKDFKAVFFAIVFFMIAFLFASLIQDCVWHDVGYKEDLQRKNNMSYWLLLGQSTRSGGRCDGDYANLTSSLRKDKNIRDSTFNALAMENVKQRGIVGNLKFYEGKLSYSFGDSSFSSFKNKCRNQLMEKFLNIYIFPRQVIWYLLLIFMCLAVLYRSSSASVLFLSIIGVALYLLLFEAESRYVFMFAPLLFVSAAIGLNLVENWGMNRNVAKNDRYLDNNPSL